MTITPEQTHLAIMDINISIKKLHLGLLALNKDIIGLGGKVIDLRAEMIRLRGDIVDLHASMAIGNRQMGDFTKWLIILTGVLVGLALLQIALYLLTIPAISKWFLSLFS